MTIHAVDVHHYTHTCPADPRRHIVGTTTKVIHTTPGRDCTQPVTIRFAGTSVILPCKRHRPGDEQCGGCRNVVTVHTVTTTHLGHHGPGEVPVEDETWNHGASA